MKKLLLGLGVVAVVVILLLATGALKLSVGLDSGAKQTKVDTSAWRSYVSKDWGYAISYPPDWIVREETGQGPKEIWLTHPTGDAIVRIFGTLDPDIRSEADMRAALQSYQDSFAKKGEESLLAFKSDVQGELAGFMAAGKMKINDEGYVFKERGLMSVKGRVLIMRGAALETEQKTLLPLADQVMDSFQVKQ